MRETERRVGKKKKKRMIGKEGGKAMNRVSEPETGLSLFMQGRRKGNKEKKPNKLISLQIL